MLEPRQVEGPPPQRVIKLVEVYGDPANILALRELERLPDVMVRHLVCPPCDPEFFIMPYIHVPEVGQYFGLDDIRNYVARELAR